MGFLDILFPKRCVQCKKIGEYICPNCLVSISFDVQNICLVCNGGSIDGLTHPGCKSRYAIDGAFCGIVYKGVVKKLIYQMKYQPYISHLADLASTLLYESLIQQEMFNQALKTDPIIIPIPLSRKKQRERGYNQSQLLGNYLSKQLGLELKECLIRTKETKPQFGLKKEERKENMKGAFEFKNAVISNEVRDPHGISLLRQAQDRNDKLSAFLVDDVLTTGSTLLEAANVLKRNGYTKVWGICLARDQ